MPDEAVALRRDDVKADAVMEEQLLDYDKVNESFIVGLFNAVTHLYL